jgi:predicted AAA+ superfamily ATPase
MEVFYWSHRNAEVDFVLVKGKSVAAIEVKSGRRKTSLAGMDAFSREFPVKRKLLVGGDGIPLEEFLLTPVIEWLR